MASVSLSLDRDLEARVSKYADGIGVPLEKLIERALVYAISSLYPDQGLPSGGRPDQGLPGEQPKPDQGLPGQPARPDQGVPGAPKPDQGLPRPPFNGRVDNELPEGEVPVTKPGEQPEVDNSLPGEGPVDPAYGKPEGKPRNPDADVNPNPDLGRKKPEPK